MQVTLGKKYRDVVTGFEWIATSLTQYLTWCDRVALTWPYNTKEGKEGDSFMCDVNMIELVDDGVVSFFDKKLEQLANTETTEKKWWPQLYNSKTAY